MTSLIRNHPSSSDVPSLHWRGDPDVIRHTGTALVAASLAAQYGFTDIDGKTPRSLTLADF